ncbi:hypothetical protein Ciccas_002806 [Cichlidogyrus casuarinus]|uniref:SCP domain-containing protein n=1 Tax=Cichlidogyrus casuarinus TaxID=1844966 RepID=A0ABD2QG60_9PLAT
MVLRCKLFLCTRYEQVNGKKVCGDASDDEIYHPSKNSPHTSPQLRKGKEIDKPKPIISLSEFSECALERHNYLRSLHGCPPLKVNQKLSKECEEYAEFLAKSGKMEHCEGDFGENLAYKENIEKVELCGAIASNMWYGEIRNYDFNKDQQLPSGHFSQLVWKACKEVGFGIAFSPNTTRAIIVARYLPPGNWRGQWAENVPRPLNGKVYLPFLEDISHSG